MDRRLYKLPFSKEKPSDWICPSCRKGVLRIVQNSFHQSELRRSRELHGHDAWEPEWVEYIYSCVLECSNDQCKEHVASSGIGNLDVDVIYDRGEPEQVWSDFFKPKFFEPPLAIIDIPDECPGSVAEPLQESFRLFFCSPPAASNNIRIALESLLTEIGVKRYVVKQSKRRYLSLHTRIGLLPAKYVGLRDLLFAIKWLGNAGSHAESAVTMDDVMDAYELIDHVLQELYAQKAKKAKALAKLVNKKRGPASK
jgi:hypothetical protein